MDILIKILQFVLSLSLLVFIHELGHFSFAKLFKIRVDKFYMFFNPNFSIVRFKKINGKWQCKWFSRNAATPTRNKLDENGAQIMDKKNRPETEAVPIEELPDSNWNKYPETTEWGIGWLPLGGYCKIAGMIDESMDREQMKQEPKPWEFRSKPAWQRLFVMIGGVLFNVLLAILIYWGTLYTWGEKYIANSDVTYGISCDTLAKEMGFQNGDKIISLDGKPVEKFDEIQIRMIRERVKNVEVERNGARTNIAIADTFISKILKDRAFIDARVPFIISVVKKDSPAEKAGIKENDKIIAINSQKIDFFDQASEILLANKGKTIDIKLLRGSDTISVSPTLSDQGLLNVGVSSDLKLTTLKFGFFEALPAGISKGLNGIRNYIRDLGLIFSPKTKAYESVGSVIAIGNIFPGSWIWQAFWALTAMLSIMLAVVNILPIPALDGGHALFTIYEIIFRRKPSDKFLEYAQMVGFFILLAIMLLALGNDVFNFLIK